MTIATLPTLVLHEHLLPLLDATCIARLAITSKNTYQIITASKIWAVLVREKFPQSYEKLYSKIPQNLFHKIYCVEINFEKIEKKIPLTKCEEIFDVCINNNGNILFYFAFTVPACNLLWASIKIIRSTIF